MFSTPPKTRATSEGPSKPKEASTSALAGAPPAREGFVRRLSGEIESLSTAARTPPTAAAPSRLLEKTITKVKAPAPTMPLVSSATQNKKALFTEPKRVVEARGKIKETKRKMDENTNMKRDVKASMHECMDALLRLLKESEEEKSLGKTIEVAKLVEIDNSPAKKGDSREEEKRMCELIEGHSKLLRESKEEMEKLKEAIEKQQELWKGSYASVAAGPPKDKPVGGTTVHSVVVSSSDDLETGDQVMEKIRKVVNAREDGMRIENIRKAKDRKVIIGCGTREEIGRVKEKLRKAGKDLNVQEIENKDPLIILRDVLKYNKDEEVVKGIRGQNGHLLKGITGKDDRIEVKYRRKTRNPHTEHVVLKVSPKIWRSLTEAGAVYVDLQRVRVSDQSPLLQCARCLGYGHGKRFCRDPVDICSHCGGPHLRAQCTELAQGKLPRCVNCVSAKMDRVDHNAFSEDCPVRRRWDALARSTVQYC